MMLDGYPETCVQACVADSEPWSSNIFYIFILSLPCPMRKQISQHLNRGLEAALMLGKQVVSRKLNRDPRFYSDSSSHDPKGLQMVLMHIPIICEQFAFFQQACSCARPKRKTDLWRDPRKGVLGPFIDGFCFLSDLNPCGPSFSHKPPLPIPITFFSNL